MIELLSRADPASDIVIDKTALRALVDEKLGLTVSLNTTPKPRSVGPLMVAAAGFAAVLALFVPQLLTRETFVPEELAAAVFGDFPGVESVIHDTTLSGGGVRTIAVEGDTIWVMSALARQLVEIDVSSNEVRTSHEIDAYVEGVVLGGGYVWLRSYDNGGEVLRFDPGTGGVDLRVQVPAISGFLAWWDNHLLVGNENGEIIQISASGQVTPFGPGEVISNEAERLWLEVEQPDGSYLLVSSSGETATFSGNVQYGLEAGGYLWVVGTDRGFYRLEIDGDSATRVGVGRFPHGITEGAGSIWVTDYQEHTLSRVNIDTAEVLSVTPLAGLPGAVAFHDGSLFVSLNHPGLLLRLDPTADLEVVGDVVVDEVTNGYRLFCSGGGDGPTILLDAEAWIGPGSWSVVQARLSRDSLVCSHGKAGAEDITSKNDDLMRALSANEINGPYVLVAVGEAAYSTPLLAAELDEVAGVVLVDPLAPGFYEWFEENLPGNLPDNYSATPDTSSLGDFGDTPLVVIGHDTDLTFNSPKASDVFGSEQNAEALVSLWEDGVDFYSGLSTDSERVTAGDSFAAFQVVWQRPDVVIEVIGDMVRRLSGR